MSGSSKGPSGPGRRLGEGMTRNPNKYQELNKHHAAGRDRKTLEAQATVASRAAADPREKGIGKPAMVNTTNWVTRAAEAVSQQLAWMHGRYGELTPEGTATVSRVAPVARSFSRTPDGPEQSTQAGQDTPSKAALSNGISVQHSTLPGLTRDDTVKSPASPAQEYVPSAAIRAYYARADAIRAERGQPPIAPPEIRQADSRNKAVESELHAKGKVVRPKSPGKAEKSQGNDIGRDIDD